MGLAIREALPARARPRPTAPSSASLRPRPLVPAFTHGITPEKPHDLHGAGNQMEGVSGWGGAGEGQGCRSQPEALCSLTAWPLWDSGKGVGHSLPHLQVLVIIRTTTCCSKETDKPPVTCRAHVRPCTNCRGNGSTTTPGCSMQTKTIMSVC